ncbi:MAG TPA: uroporphyrinogen-III C-methyltransferase, partial [Chitinophagaceae bacterium]|nr:uroporphyrinogen-III C-methyltransferase [Chitinophagaceae bacterium]
MRRPGKVVLAGAGPGDEELITIKLQHRLAEADVIITDRLVNSLIITLNARKDVEIILAGKKGYNKNSLSQEQVTALIIEHAGKGKNVLRLKGGDVAFFSNLFDELVALKENKIPFEIIPGITAASGASAYTGIPLTARNYSQGVQCLTFNPNSNYSPAKWRQLAASGDTLVFYMAASTICVLSQKLMDYDCPASTGIAVIEQATTIYQHVHVSTLENCRKDFSESAFSSPSLVIVGDVVRLHDQFNWFQSIGTGSVF